MENIDEVCDARNINRADESADIVLLMGPLYHLQINSIIGMGGQNE